MNYIKHAVWSVFLNIRCEFHCEFVFRSIVEMVILRVVVVRQVIFSKRPMSWFGFSSLHVDMVSVVMRYSGDLES